jgi:hypothetical protein
MANYAALEAALVSGLGPLGLIAGLPGPRLADVVELLSVIAAANDTLAEYHEQRRATLSS